MLGDPPGADVDEPSNGLDPERTACDPPGSCGRWPRWAGSDHGVQSPDERAAGSRRPPRGDRPAARLRRRHRVAERSRRLVHGDRVDASYHGGGPRRGLCPARARRSPSPANDTVTVSGLPMRSGSRNCWAATRSSSPSWPRPRARWRSPTWNSPHDAVCSFRRSSAPCGGRDDRHDHPINGPAAAAAPQARTASRTDVTEPRETRFRTMRAVIAMLAPPRPRAGSDSLAGTAKDNDTETCVTGYARWSPDKSTPPGRRARHRQFYFVPPHSTGRETAACHRSDHLAARHRPDAPAPPPASRRIRAPAMGPRPAILVTATAPRGIALAEGYGHRPARRADDGPPDNFNQEHRGPPAPCVRTRPRSGCG